MSTRLILQKVFRSASKRLDALARDDTAKRIPAADAIHETRTLTRQCAALLRTFRDELEETNAEELRRKLQKLSKAFGTSRDATIRLALFKKNKIAGAMKDARGWREFLRDEIRAERAARAALAGIWTSPPWIETTAALRDFVASIAAKNETAASVEKKIERRMKKARRRISRRVLNDASDLHELRKRLRQIRYLADAFAPSLSAKTNRALTALREFEGGLGKLHDCDVIAAQLETDPSEITRHLARELRRRRKTNTARLLRDWNFRR